MTGAPDLPGVVAAFNRASAEHVIIGGGFAVIAHEHVRATEDTDLLIPEDDANDERVVTALQALAARRTDGVRVGPDDVAGRSHLRVECREHGLVDLLREGVAPLDFATVRATAISAEVRGVLMGFAGLESLVAFKRLAGRPKDRQDLDAPPSDPRPPSMVPIPGVDGP